LEPRTEGGAHIGQFQMGQSGTPGSGLSESMEPKLLITERHSQNVLEGEAFIILMHEAEFEHGW